MDFSELEDNHLPFSEPWFVFFFLLKLEKKDLYNKFHGDIFIYDDVKCCLLTILEPVQPQHCKRRIEISCTANNPQPGVMCLRNGPGARQISF
jgi:hypothetical protein